MRVWVVTKSPVDLPDTFEFIGAFTSRDLADGAVIGAGTYKIAEMEVDRRYSGDLLNVFLRDKLTSRQI